MDTTLFEEWLLAQGLEASTVAMYRGKVEQADGLTCERGWDLRHIGASQLVWLASQFPQSRATLGVLRASLGHYWSMCDVVNPAPAIKLPKPPAVEEYRGLEDVDADRLEARAHELGHPKGTAILLGLYLGLRRAEMAQMRWEHYERDLEWARVLGKGRRYRLLPVHESLQAALRPIFGEGYVFPGKTRPHIHTGTVYGWIRSTAQSIGIDDISPHALRHTCLTNMYDETGDLRAVQYFAGHSDPATTAKYTRVTRRRLVMAVSTLPYGNRAA